MPFAARAAAAVALTFLATAPLTGCASLMDRLAAKESQPQGPVSLTAEEAALLTETNLIRKAHGLKPVQADAKLVAIARARSRDMAKRDYLDHMTPEGRSVFGIMRDNKVYFGAAGENIAKQVRTATEAPREVVAGWAKTPAHRTNLLGEGFSRVGIGAVRTTDGKTVLVTQIFAD